MGSICIMVAATVAFAGLAYFLETDTSFGAISVLVWFALSVLCLVTAWIAWKWPTQTLQNTLVACEKCGANVSDESSYCTTCGRQLEAIVAKRSRSVWLLASGIVLTPFQIVRDLIVINLASVSAFPSLAEAQANHCSTMFWSRLGLLFSICTVVFYASGAAIIFRERRSSRSRQLIEIIFTCLFN